MTGVVTGAVAVSRARGPVGNTVHPAVDLMRTAGRPSLLHSFAARRPPLSSYARPQQGDQVFNVTAAGYEAIHTVHSPYYFYS